MEAVITAGKGLPRQMRRQDYNLVPLRVPPVRLAGRCSVRLLSV